MTKESEALGFGLGEMLFLGLVPALLAFQYKKGCPGDGISPVSFPVYHFNITGLPDGLLLILLFRHLKQRSLLPTSHNCPFYGNPLHCSARVLYIPHY